MEDNFKKEICQRIRFAEKFEKEEKTMRNRRIRGIEQKIDRRVENDEKLVKEQEGMFM